MTVETKTTVEFKDLFAVEFHCGACGAIIVRKLDQQIRIPIVCGNCDRQYDLPVSPRLQALLQLFRSMARFSGEELSYELRLEVAGLQKPVDRV
jgi:hypothetical protein